MLKYYESYEQYDVPIILRDELFDKQHQPLSQIKNLNKVNIFVGANNAGKSFVLRELLKAGSNATYGSENWKSILRITEIYSTIISELKRVSQIDNLTVFGDTHNGTIIDLTDIQAKHRELVRNSPDFSIEKLIGHLTEVFNKSFEVRNGGHYFVRNDSNSQSEFNNTTNSDLLHSIFSCLRQLKEQVMVVLENLRTLRVSELVGKGKRIFIPSVRSLRPFASHSKIEGFIKNEYRFNEQVEIYTGESFPDLVGKKKNNYYKERRIIEEYEKFLSTEFFENREIGLNYHSTENVLLIKIGDEKDRPIYELGDGLQMIIILTFPFFLFEGGTIVIDEPELFIHPGLQKALVKFFVDNAKTDQFQIFIATHSNHILDSINSSELISIYSVQKEEKVGDSSIEKSPNFILDNLAHGHENILNLLGVSTSSVYLSNCTIWVEGITDKLYIQKFIEEYLKQDGIQKKYEICRGFREGINYSFALSGGDSIVHWDFDTESEYHEIFSKIIVQKFCSKAFVIVDCDFGKNPERKKAFNQALGERFLELSLPEIENYLPASVILKVIRTYASVEKNVGNDQLIPATEEVNKTTKIGKMIDENVLSKYPGVKKFSAPNGGLKPGDKYVFCTLSLPYIDPSSVSSEISKLVEKLLDFIIANN